MEFLLLLWLLFGIVCAVVASQKGCSGVGWFFVRCLIGHIRTDLNPCPSLEPAVAGSHFNSERTEKGLPVLR